MLLNSVKMTNYESKTFAHMELAGALVKMQVNSVALCNVLSRKPLPKDSIIDRTDVKLTTYSKARLKVLGITKVQLQNPKNQKKYPVVFVYINLLGTLHPTPWLRIHAEDGTDHCEAGE